MKNKIIDTENGLMYISSKGIEYDILEGTYTGGKISSDILFIFLNNPDYNCKDHYVGYLYGANQLKHDKSTWGTYQESLHEMTREFEKKNHIGQLSILNSNDLSVKIIDCLSDGYDDEENREEEETILYNELSQISGDSIIRVVLQRLCERIEDLS